MTRKVNTKAKNWKDIDFKNAGIADVQFSSGIVKLGGLYRVRLPWQKCLIATALGLLLAVATLFFLKNTGLYSAGAIAFCQGIARIVNTFMDIHGYDPEVVKIVYNILFWGIYLVFNIVLLVFFIYKMNKEFVYLSAIFICVSQVSGIALSFIPGIENIHIFGDTSTVNAILKEARVECVVFFPNIYPSISGESFDWSNQLVTCKDSMISSAITSENLTKAFSLVIYSLLYTIIYAFCNAGVFILGGSSMGTESIAIYISEKKNEDVGLVLRTIQMICLVAGVLMGSYCCGILAGQNYIENHPGCEATASTYASWQYIFNANLVASFIFVIINAALINSLFPTRKLVRVEIFTKEAKQVLDNLRTRKYPHPTTVVHSFGGYSGVSNNIITTVLPLMSLSNYIATIREVDKVCLIAVTKLDDCVGRMGLEKHINLKAAYDRERAEALAKANTNKQLKNKLDIKEIHETLPDIVKTKKKK
ncbi:MAG: YitT family protein [Malacoplasma sp.]|nr:YitT family protein [Malacoplasma sp.]